MPTTPLRPDHVAFALGLNAVLSDDTTDTGAMWSPYSVACALGLVASGAAGATREELTGLLGPDIDAVLAGLDEAVEGGPELASRTALWLRGDIPVHEDFEARVRARPDSDVRVADFRGDPEGVRARINDDVATTTRGMITDLLTSGSINPGTISVLVNALWVKMRWLTPFTTDSTVDHPFRAPSGTRETATMSRTGQLPYAVSGGWRMVTLAGHDELFMDVLLPPEDDPGAVLDEKTLGALYQGTDVVDVRLMLPRFDITHHQELTEPLVAAGVHTVFGDGADLSGLSPVPLKVDQVIHQAKLRVDEKGAEGAAATAVVMMRASITPPPPPVPFVVDRPFRIILRRRGAILFLGEVTEPEDPGPAE
ncbi:serpin family protein [Nocardiopsis ansamitocini]|uniref:Serine protease n=1 Tax=Nocardiopsis ansamitocini TaxID=1670832 RepID=A0A9W6UJN8_9ACTN|nr:serpin family protein [Nocardiopsis ansamitocini]GLU49024.1 serine protease [Nocardiopsis ansamitocini]